MLRRRMAAFPGRLPPSRQTPKSPAENPARHQPQPLWLDHLQLDLPIDRVPHISLSHPDARTHAKGKARHRHR